MNKELRTTKKGKYLIGWGDMLSVVRKPKDGLAIRD